MKSPLCIGLCTPPPLAPVRSATVAAVAAVAAWHSPPAAAEPCAPDF